MFLNKLNIADFEQFDEVRSLTSVLNYQDPERNIPLIAEELEVNYILEGSFKRISDGMKVTAQLIEPKSDKHIWLMDYELPYKEVIGIPAEIALQIADHLKVFISDDEHERINKTPTNNLEAYELLIQAEYLFLTQTFVSFDQLVDSSLKAVELDPEYAEAYISAARYTLYKGLFWGNSDSPVIGWEAKKYVDKALELDQNNVTAHVILGVFNEYYNWNYIKAEEEYRKAIELEPKVFTDIQVIFEFSYNNNDSNW